MDQEPRDEAPLVESAAKDSDLRAKVERAILDAPQPVRKLLSKAGPFTVRPIAGETAGYLHEEVVLEMRANTARDIITHELGHHVDWQLGMNTGTVSADASSIIGKGIVRQIDYFSRVVTNEELRIGFRTQVRASGNLFLEDLFGALTLNKVGGGHADSYWTGPHGAKHRVREVFANLFTLYSTGNWSRVKRLLPEIAEAFELWIESELL